jgi:hypothetical protein
VSVELKDIASLPVIRGKVCINNWNISGVGFHILLARQLQEDVTDNWQAELGEQIIDWVENHREWIYFFCPNCNNCI